MKKNHSSTFIIIAFSILFQLVRLNANAQQWLDKKIAIPFYTDLAD